ncbi:uncharacterized protein PAC_19237 [Phialocephala subalpina]|uniref:Uncharacterized protein n=1 Tax=Phialocephala subalpina TaxID=576137 RepID=A0A1L7XWF6_9HELO|nr:uncharacterized protein PAC_19237 [Phialocephala subalpina]
MAQFGSNGQSNLGSLGIRPFLSLAPLPTIVAEWTSLIPLACHLASHQYSHRLAGELAITGRLSIGLFPKLGVLDNVARLIKDGTEFFDRASTLGNVGNEVWDVMWGSTFPCANGAASAIIAAYALRNSKEALDLDDYHDGRIEKHAKPHRRSTSSSQLPFSRICDGKGWHWGPICKAYLTQTFATCTPTVFDTPIGVYRRYQTLHILDFRRTPIIFSWHLRLYRLMSSIRWDILMITLLLIGDVFLGLFGLYGTTAAVLCGIVSRVACRFLRFKRPPGFLTNNETHDACMLVAAHRNASTWYLFRGDRGIVDYLLNKPMISPPEMSAWVHCWFRIGHISQILSMTFVAAQRGWDGVAMTVLMLLEKIWDSYWNHHCLGEQWLESQGIRIEARNFRFTGRTQMIATIQALSGSSNISWMDDIIVPHPRRDALLKYLDAITKEPEEKPEIIGLDERDVKWIALQARLAVDAAATIRREFPYIVQV